MEKKKTMMAEEEEEPKKKHGLARLPRTPINFEFQDGIWVRVKLEFPIPRTSLICNSKKGIIIGGPEESVDPEAGKLQGKGKKKRPPVDFDALFRNHCYLLPGAKLPAKKFVAGQKIPFWKNTFGHPSKAWKDCIITALSQKLGLTPWSIKGFIHSFGTGEDPSLAVLKYKYGRVREDTLPILKNGMRTGMHTTWRPEFFGVETELRICWEPKLLGTGERGMKNIVNALKHGGQWVGVGDGRNEKSGYPVGLFMVRSIQGERRK